MTYASEIWISDYKLDLLDDKYPFELVHLKSCKFSLAFHNKTSNLAAKCELDRFPVLLSILTLVHGFYCRLTKLSSDRLLHKIYQTDKHLFLKGSKSWFTNIRNTEKFLNIQQLENYNKDAFINILQTFYRNKLEKSLDPILIYISL